MIPWKNSVWMGLICEFPKRIDAMQLPFLQNSFRIEKPDNTGDMENGIRSDLSDRSISDTVTNMDRIEKGPV